MTEVERSVSKHYDDSSGPWLHAWFDPLAAVHTVTGCVRLGDLFADGDCKMLICDLDKKLKVYKGTTMLHEYALLDSPVAACIFYTDTFAPRTPSIAVAAGSHLFIYRNMRPYKKWTCPLTEPTSTETEIWSQLKRGEMDAETAYSNLMQARESGIFLTARSLDLILLEEPSRRAEYVDEVKGVQFAQQTLITCLETLKRDSDDHDGVTLCVVGTESSHVYILPPDCSGSTSLCKVAVGAVPVLMCPSGRFDVEWRVMVACRDGRLYSIKEGDVRGTAVLTGNVIDLGAQAIAMAREDKLTWVATTDRTISCYTTRGKRTASISLTEDVTDMCVISLKKSKVTHALLVGLSNGEVRMYQGSTILHSFSVEKPVVALRFGFYGREDNSLVIVHGKGSAITIKMLRRTVDLDAMVAQMRGPPMEQDIPLSVPKKTKLFVEQTQREREQAMDIHRAFQKDLCKLRLSTARSYVKTLTDGHMGVTSVGGSSSGRGSDIRVHAIVNGLGPKFLMRVELQNASSVPLFGVMLFCACDPKRYSVIGVGGSRQGAGYCIPVLLPGPKHFVEMNVLSLDPLGRAGQVLITLSQNDSTEPLLSATVRMPASELVEV